MKQYQTVLVTGGAGFIGSNFVLQILAANVDVRVCNLDLLTYAGNPENLASIANDPRYNLTRGDICDSALVRKKCSCCFACTAANIDGHA